MRGSHERRLEALEARVGKMARATSEQLKAQRAWAHAEFTAWMNASVEAIEKEEADSFEFEYPPYPGQWIDEPRDKRGSELLRRISEYINTQVEEFS
jgi:hypothetical protein